MGGVAAAVVSAGARGAAREAGAQQGGAEGGAPPPAKTHLGPLRVPQDEVLALVLAHVAPHGQLVCKHLKVPVLLHCRDDLVRLLGRKVLRRGVAGEGRGRRGEGHGGCEKARAAGASALRAQQGALCARRRRAKAPPRRARPQNTTHLHADLLELHVLPEVDLVRRLHLAVAREALAQVLVHGGAVLAAKGQGKVAVGLGGVVHGAHVCGSAGWQGRAGAGRGGREGVVGQGREEAAAASLNGQRQRRARKGSTHGTPPP